MTGREQMRKVDEALLLDQPSPPPRTTPVVDLDLQQFLTKNRRRSTC